MLGFGMGLVLGVLGFGMRLDQRVPGMLDFCLRVSGCWGLWWSWFWRAGVWDGAASMGLRLLGLVRGWYRRSRGCWDFGTGLVLGIPGTLGFGMRLVLEVSGVAGVQDRAGFRGSGAAWVLVWGWFQGSLGYWSLR